MGGASVAYHLAERGETDVVLLERAELTSGSTFHSAGLVGQLRSDPALTRMNVYSVELYRRLERTEHAPGWVESGSLRLASSPVRLEEIRRQNGWARRSGLPLDLISADEARELFPLMSTENVLGAAYTPTDGHVDPARLCYALAALARDGRGPDRAAHARGRDRDGGVTARAPGVRRADRSWRRRVRGGARLRRDVRRRDRPDGRRPDPGGADVAPVRRHRALPRRRAPRTGATRRCPRCATPTCSSTTARRWAGW